MLWRIWLVVAVAAFVLTLCWLFVERRLFLTTGVTAGLWAWCSTTAGDLELRSLEAGTTVALDVPSLQWLTLGMALFSLLALTLHYFGAYPPREDTLSDTQPR